MSVLNKFLTVIAVILALCFIAVSFLTLYERHQMKIEIVEQAKEKGTEILENIGIPTTPIPPVAPIEPGPTKEAEPEPSSEPSPEPSDEPEEETEDENTEEVGSDIEKEQTDKQENKQEQPVEKNVTYRNHRVLEIDIRDGMVMTVGVDGPSLTDAIYIDPTFRNEERPEDRYAFYISTEYGRLDSSNSQRGTADSDLYPGCQSFIIMNRTYDTLMSAEFKNQENYGVRWVMDKPIEEVKEKQGMLYIRAVSLDTGMMLGTAEIKIAYLESAKAFEIASGYSSDIMYSVSYTDADRKELLEDTVKFFVEGTDEFTIGFNDPSSLEPMLEFASVEQVPHPYFSKLYTDKSIAFRNNTLNGYTLIAVNIPHKDFGVLTAYFIPWEESGKEKPQPQEPEITEEVYNTPNDEYNENMPEDSITRTELVPAELTQAAAPPKQDNFVLVGYDALMPFSQSTFIDNLYPDDIEFFTSTPTQETTSAEQTVTINVG